MPDFDAIIIGGGPAGLTAGLYLSRGKYRALLIDKDGFGGNIKNAEWIENYPGFSDGVAGPQLASEMTIQAVNSGLQMEMAEVAGIESYSESTCVQLTDARYFTAKVLIIASGGRPRKLNIPGERELEGKGVFDCALCDGGQFHGKTVAVCGAGDRGVTEALYLAKIAAKVYLIEVEGTISASAILKARVCSNNKIELRCGAELVKISGSGKVEAVEIRETAVQKTETVGVDGVLIAVGTDPNTGFIRNLVSLDNEGRILVNERMQTNLPNIFAAGDVRSNSRGQIVTAAGDGATAAIAVQRLMDPL